VEIENEQSRETDNTADSKMKRNCFLRNVTQKIYRQLRPSDQQEILHIQYGHIIEKITEIPKSQSEDVNRRKDRQYNGYKIKRTNRQNITQKN
jgi:hypothetical protein